MLKFRESFTSTVQFLNKATSDKSLLCIIFQVKFGFITVQCLEYCNQS